MEFMENVKNVVTDTAQTVVKKTGELLEASKIKYSIFDLKSDIKKLYAQIGEMYYQNKKSGEQDENSMQELCDLIDAKYAQIDALNAKLEDVKNQAKCPACGRICDAELNYCPFCGAEMTVNVTPDVVVAESPETEAVNSEDKPEENKDKAEA